MGKRSSRLAGASTVSGEGGASGEVAEDNGAGGLQPRVWARDNDFAQQGQPVNAEGGVIAAAIARIMQKVGFVEKNGTNEGPDAWKYATIEDVMSKLQPELANEGLIDFQTQLNSYTLLNEQLLAIEYGFTLVHKSGAREDVAGSHTGMSSLIDQNGAIDDKAANKCHTAARKYFWIALLKIPVKNIADGDREANRRGRKPLVSTPVSAPPAEASPTPAPTKPKPVEVAWESPHELAPFGDGEATAWASKFAAHLRACKTEAEIEGWWLNNDPSLSQLAIIAEPMHARLVVIENARKEEIRAAKAANAGRAVS